MQLKKCFFYIKSDFERCGSWVVDCTFCSEVSWCLCSVFFMILVDCFIWSLKYYKVVGFADRRFYHFLFNENANEKDGNQF